MMVWPNISLSCREKVEQRDLLGKLGLWDPKVPLESLVLRVFVESLALL